MTGKQRTANDAAQELRDLIREANGVTKDLQRVVKEVREFLAKDGRTMASDELQRHMKAAMEELGADLKRTLDQAETKITNRFMLSLDYIMADAKRRAVEHEAQRNTRPLEVLQFASVMGTDLLAEEVTAAWSGKRDDTPEMRAVAKRMERGLEQMRDAKAASSAFGPITTDDEAGDDDGRG